MDDKEWDELFREFEQELELQRNELERSRKEQYADNERGMTESSKLDEDSASKEHKKSSQKITWRIPFLRKKYRSPYSEPFYKSYGFIVTCWFVTMGSIYGVLSFSPFWVDYLVGFFVPASALLIKSYNLFSQVSFDKSKNIASVLIMGSICYNPLFVAFFRGYDITGNPFVFILFFTVLSPWSITGLTYWLMNLWIKNNHRVNGWFL